VAELLVSGFLNISKTFFKLDACQRMMTAAKSTWPRDTSSGMRPIVLPDTRQPETNNLRRFKATVNAQFCSQTFGVLAKVGFVCPWIV